MYQRAMTRPKARRDKSKCRTMAYWFKYGLGGPSASWMLARGCSSLLIPSGLYEECPDCGRAGYEIESCACGKKAEIGENQREQNLK